MTGKRHSWSSFRDITHLFDAYEKRLAWNRMNNGPGGEIILSHGEQAAQSQQIRIISMFNRYASLEIFPEKWPTPTAQW